MKKVITLICLCLLANENIQAQFAPLGPAKPAKKTPVKMQASPGLTAEPTRPATTPAPAPDYYISNVRVNIKTGNDNKESLSNVSVELWARDTRFTMFAQNDLTNEMRSNTTTPIGLESSSKYTSAVQPGRIPTYYQTKPAGTQPLKLKDFEAYGLALRIIYKPNLFTDAWKIENVSVSFEFKDLQGNAHPTHGIKNISFNNAATFLDNFDKRMLICTADQNFNPLTSFVTKDISRLW